MPSTSIQVQRMPPRQPYQRQLEVLQKVRRGVADVATSRKRVELQVSQRAPLGDQLTVTGEHDCLGRICRDVHRDLPTTVVIECLGDDLSRRSLVMHDRTTGP
jgi:hypothetical protein